MTFTLQEIITTWNAIYKTDIVVEFEDFINALEDLEAEKEDDAADGVAVGHRSRVFLHNTE